MFYNVIKLTCLVSQGNSYWHCLVSLQQSFLLFASVSHCFLPILYCLTVISVVCGMGICLFHMYFLMYLAFHLYLRYMGYSVLGLFGIVHWQCQLTSYSHLDLCIHCLSSIILHHIWSVLYSCLAHFQ